MGMTNKGINSHMPDANQIQQDLIEIIWRLQYLKLNRDNENSISNLNFEREELKH